MTALQAQAIQKSVRFMTNSKGEETDIVFSLNNKQVQEFFEDLFDTLVAVERQDEKGIPFDEFKKQFYQSRTTTA
jgi:hypothetical protein